MNRLQFLTFATICLCVAATLRGEAPFPVADVAPLADIELEIQERLEEADQLAADQEAFKEAQENGLKRTAGVLAVMGQSLAEHAQREESEINGPALRDAALALYKAKTLDDAQAAVKQLHQAAEGEGPVDLVAMHPWNKLINMHPMMEEIEDRSGKLVRVARRPRGRAEESAHASTVALLTLAMYADTHEVKNEDEIPEWQRLAREYQELNTGLAAALRDKDGRKAKELLTSATKSCNACHEKFRD